MQYFEKDFGKLLKQGALNVRRMQNAKQTDCMRVYDRNLEQFPVTVDVYGPYVRVTDYSEDGLAEDLRTVCLDVCSRMLYVPADKVLYHRRPRRQDGQQHEGLEAEPLYVEVMESGHRFKLDLTSHIDVGLFMDQIKVRQYIESQAMGKSVLNLFSYTGSFSVYAASGGAEKVTSVDLSGPYTRWCEENLRLNGFTGSQYECINADALTFIKQAREKRLKYDIVIFDPPCFSNSHKMERDFDVQRDYSFFIRMLFGIISKGGFLLFSTNLGTFVMDRRRLGHHIEVQGLASEFAAPGFSTRKGASRSWILTSEDDFLTLDWEKEEAKMPKASEEAQKEEPTAEETVEQEDKAPVTAEEGEKKPYDNGGQEASHDNRDSRGSYGDKRSDRRSSYSDRDGGERRSYSDRPRRSYDEDRPRRSFDSDRPRRSYDDKPAYGERRSFDSDRPRRSFDEDRPRRSFDSDRPRRSFDNKPAYGEHKSFDSDRPRRSYDDKPSYGEHKSFDSDRPRRSYGDRPSYGEHKSFGSDRPRRPFDGERKSFGAKDDHKPYGYDKFKATRDRNDDKAFFWLEDDAKKED